MNGPFSHMSCILIRQYPPEASPSLAEHRTYSEGHQYLPPLQLSVNIVTCGPGPQTSRPHGTSCRPQTGYKLQVRAAGDRGQRAGSRPAGGPGPLPRSPQRCIGGPLLLPQRGPQTPPLGAPQRPDLGKDGSVQKESRQETHTKRPVRGQSESNLSGEMSGEQSQKRQDREK